MASRSAAAAVAGLAAAGLLAAGGGPPRALAQGTGITYRLAETWSEAPWRLTAGRFAHVLDITSTADGTRYVLDGIHEAVHVLGPDGTARAVWTVPAPGTQGPRAVRRIDAAEDGTLWLLSAVGGPEPTAWVDRLDGAGRRRAGFAAPVAYADVAAGPRDTVLLARTVPRIAPTPVPGPEQPRLPGGIDVVDAAGHLLESIEHRSIFYPVSLDVAPDGRIIVANRVPSPWDYEHPGPRPTTEPSSRPGTGPGARTAQEPRPVVEGVVEFGPDHVYRRTTPFVTPEDVATGPAGDFVGRNVEVFAVGEDEPLYSGPPGSLVVGFVDGFVLHLDAPADGSLAAGIAHCAFQGVLDFPRPADRPATPDLDGALDRPRLAGPYLPRRIDASSRVALLQGRFAFEGGQGGLVIAGADAPEPQSVQLWTPDGALPSQIGVCAGSTSGWMSDRGDAMWAQDVAVDGSVVYTIERQVVQRRSGDRFPDWSVMPAGTYAPGSSSLLAAISADGGRVAVLDAGAARVVLLDGAGTIVTSWPLGRGGTDALPSDLALTGDRVYVSYASALRIDVFDVSGAAIGSWPTPDGAWRLDATADAVVALGRRGWAVRYAPDGAVQAAWPMPESSAEAVDVAVDQDARVLVAFVARTARPGPEDSVVYEVRRAGVWRFAPVPAEPSPPPSARGCVVHVDKTAAPDIVRLGGTTEVRLVVQGACPGRYEPVRLVILLDKSRSMRWNGALDRARERIADLLEALPPDAAEVGLVTFDEAGALAVPPTRDLPRVLEALLAIEGRGDTRLAPGLASARAALELSPAEPGTALAVVIVTDAQFNDGPADAAAALRAAGIDLRAVLLPHGGISGFPAAFRSLTGREPIVDPDPAAMRALADEVVRYRSEPGLFQRLSVTDELPPNMQFVEGSARPSAVHDPAARTVRWDLGPVTAAEGAAMQLSVRPLETGDHPTNVRAEASFRDALGGDGSAVFPVPRVWVWDLSSLSYHAWLPLAATRSCFRGPRPLDVALVMDASQSMSEPAPEGGTKIDAAREAAGSFLDLLRLGGDRAAVVAFNERAYRLSSLTGDRAALAAALSRISTAPGTRIDVGLSEAEAVLSAGPDRGAQGVVVVLTDGLQTGTADPVVGAAERLRSRGILVYAIGLGAEVDRGLLERVSTTPEGYLASPSPADLAAAYARIVSLLACRPR